ncbi:MAG: ATP-binding protein [Clostridia bacterium]
MEPDLIKTLLLNLVDNARKASQPEQTITIEGRVSGDGIELKCGMKGAEWKRRNLGESRSPFYMVDKSRARQQHGAGLGLSLCREIARFHDTDLSFWSQVGKGTRVWLELEIDVGEEPGEYEG